MSFNPPKPPDFIERVFERKYLYFLICAGVFLDIIYRFNFGVDISFLKKSDFDMNLTYGNILVTIIGYLLLMSWMPRIRHNVLLLLWKPLCWIYVKNIEIPIAPKWIAISDLKNYARDHNSTILWEEIKEREKRDSEIELMNDLRFSVGLMLVLNIWIPKCLCHEMISRATGYWPVIISIGVTLVLIRMIGCSLTPYDPYHLWMHMPDHPLAEKQRDERRKHDGENKLREPISSIVPLPSNF